MVDILTFMAKVEMNIRKATEKQGYEFLMARHSTTHLQDSYLYVVIAKRDDDDWVTWTYNSDSDTLFSGNYTSDMTSAISDYRERV